ncbi:hypothetical protein THIOKS1990004 [Thiocapsa sp. KS1]|nr:hypothetical protein THIOKS1990004 [Thiocapsa sp. KS1]
MGMLWFDWSRAARRMAGMRVSRLTALGRLYAPDAFSATRAGVERLPVRPVNVAFGHATALPCHE